MSRLQIFAPASVSNVACGFDTLGFAVGEDESLGDLITVSLKNIGEQTPGKPGPGEPAAGGPVAGEAKGSRITLSAITGEGGRLPRDPRRNTATVAAQVVLNLFAQKGGTDIAIDMAIEKRMPLCSGLGSSAASAVAGSVAAYEILRREFGFILSEPELLECALAGELVASGGRHADNVAPCMLGGFVLVRSLDDQPDVVQLPDCDDWLWCALARPSIAIDTLSSRQRLGTTIPLATATRQWANVGALVAALYERDDDLLARALCDHVAEPARKNDVAGFDDAVAAAIEAGALGGSLSGSGPTLFALATSAERASDAASAMADALLAAGHPGCDAQTSPVGTRGARVIEP